MVLSRRARRYGQLCVGLCVFAACLAKLTRSKRGSSDVAAPKGRGKTAANPGPRLCTVSVSPRLLRQYIVSLHCHKAGASAFNTKNPLRAPHDAAASQRIGRSGAGEAAPRTPRPAPVLGPVLVGKPAGHARLGIAIAIAQSPSRLQPPSRLQTRPHRSHHE